MALETGTGVLKRGWESLRILVCIGSVNQEPRTSYTPRGNGFGLLVSECIDKHVTFVQYSVHLTIAYGTQIWKICFIGLQPYV